MIDHYDWAGGREAMLRFGPSTGPAVMMLLPLFEEHNRTRSFAVTLCRALADLGLASVMPDLPGQGESLVPTAATTVMQMREAVEALVDKLLDEGRVTYAAAIRGGALLDSLGLFAGRWYLAPQPGSALLRELTRIKQAELALAQPLPECWWFDGSLPADAHDPPVEVAGNLIAADLLTALSVLDPWDATDGGPVRTVRLESDPAPADIKFAGAPLWRRSEPGNDPALAALLAADIAAWIRVCEA